MVRGHSEAFDGKARRGFRRLECACVSDWRFLLESNLVDSLGASLYIITLSLFPFVYVQSFDGLDDSMSDTPKKKQTKKEAESPAEASKAQISKIEAELTKILKDSGNDDMSYAGMQTAWYIGCVHAWSGKCTLAGQ